jgi:hypothetical protein
MNSTSSIGRAPWLLIVGVPVGLAAAGWFMLGGRPAAHASLAQAGAGGFVYNAAACASSPDLGSIGWDYPKPAAAVEEWVRTRDVRRSRTHGWWLWAALNQQADTPGGAAPLWRGWCTATQAYAATGGEPPASSGASASAKGRPAGLALHANRDSNNDNSSDPIQLPKSPAYPVPAQLQHGKCYRNGNLTDGASFANNGDVMVAGVVYNAPAYNWIRNNGFYLQSTLNKAMPPKGRIGSIGQMPAGSVVLKPMMWPVPATGYSALPVWDGPTQDNGTYAGFENKALWPRAVAVTAQTGGPARADVTYLHGVQIKTGGSAPITYRQAPVVPVTQFYRYQPYLAGMEECDRALLDASALYAFNRRFQQGDWLVLIAMHIMTKEQPNWTFQSTYWSDRPDEGQEGKDKPIIPSAQGPWRHYKMASTYGMAASTRPPVWGVAFNPYIELAADHPIQTNCMNCHHRAGWPARAAAKTAQYLTSLPTDPGKIGVLSPDNPIFRDLALTDSQWSLPNRAKGLQSGAAKPKK